MHELKEKYDVIIVGGGLVGASLAVLLAQLPINILLVEKFSLPKSNDALAQNFDARSTALSYGAKKIYSEAGVWSQLAPFTSAIQTVHVSHKGKWGSVQLHAQEERLEALGYVIENHFFGNTLAQYVKSFNNVTWCAPASVDAVIPKQQGVNVTITRDNEQVSTHAGLLVVADGAQSPTCKKIAIDHQHKQYQQTAIVSNIACEFAHAGQAFERFTKRGPMALLPLPDFETKTGVQHRMSLVWVLPHDDAAFFIEADDAVCLQQLEKVFGLRLGRLQSIGKRASFPLSLRCAKEQVRSSIVVIGNAAHSLHPVAGQGFNLSLRDCAHLVKTLEQGMANNIPLGDLSLLESYQAQQQYDQRRTIFMSDNLPALFAKQGSILGFGRQAGLIGLDVFAGLRSDFLGVMAGASVPPSSVKAK